MTAKITDQKSDRLEISRLNGALRVFFDYADRRSFLVFDPPPELQEAFDSIMTYYDKRLKNIVKLFPNEYLSRIYDSGDLYAYAWGKFWESGHRIAIRTPAGVYAWLKRVVSNHKYDMRKKHRYLVPWDDQIEEETASRIEMTGVFLEKPGRLWDNDDVHDHDKLLHELVEKALTKLTKRQQQVIKLAMNGYSLQEIAHTMNFPNRNAVSSFKKRAFKRLGKHLYTLFVIELDHPAAAMRRKLIIEDWIERFYGKSRKMCDRRRELMQPERFRATKVSLHGYQSLDRWLEVFMDLFQTTKSSLPEPPPVIQSIIKLHWQQLEDCWRMNKS